MSHAGYPQVADLSARLFSTGLIDAPPTDLQDQIDVSGALAAAVNDFESTTGYQPFIGTTQTRKFNPPGPTVRGQRYGYRARGGERILPLKNTGLVTLTSLTTGVDAVSAGTLRTLNTDFYLGPENADQDGRPWTQVEFVQPVYGAQNSVVIVGKWGYSLTCPDDVFEALQDYAMWKLSPRLALLISGGLYSERRLNAETRYGGGGVTPLSAEAVLWKKSYDDCCDNYLRL